MARANRSKDKPMPDPALLLTEAARHFASGDRAAGEAICARLEAEHADNPGVPHLRALAALSLGRTEEALSWIGEAIGRAGTRAGLRFVQGAILVQAGRGADALAAFDCAIERDPGMAQAHAARGLQLLDLARPAEALGSLELAVALRPGDAESHHNRGNALEDLGRATEAVAAYDTALGLRPDVADTHSARAVALAGLSRHAEALDAFDRAVALCPDRATTHAARAAVLHALRRNQQALEACDRAIALQEDFAEAWHNKAIVLLALGCFAEGFPLYEWRWFTKIDRRVVRLFRQPMWDGAPFPGQTLLIHAEQGLGDTVQCLRFARAAQSLGDVVFEVAAPLYQLLAAQPDGPRIVRQGDALPRFDLHCPAMSLPWLFGTELATIPPAAPFLRPDPALAAVWEARIPPRDHRRRIGIAWAGNPGQAADARRSMPLATMLAAFGPETVVVTLQKEVPEPDRAVLARATHVVGTGDLHTDMAETAAAIGRLDLVVSVDTSVAHVAAAMGVPVWVPLCYAPDWRWLLDRDDTPWYPAMRLFRQDRPGDWGGPIGRIADALRTGAA